MDILLPTDKSCTICMSTKPLVDFGKNLRSKDGLSTYCRSCKSIMGKKYREMYPDETKRRAATARRKRTPEQINSQKIKSKAYRASKSEEISIQKKISYEKNKKLLPKMKKPCTICNNEFETSSYIKKTCGKNECFKEHQSRNVKSNYRKRNPLIDKECFICGGVFRASSKSGVKTCSRECSRASKKILGHISNKLRYELLQKKCEFCTTEFETRKSLKKFCSFKCSLDSHAKDYAAIPEVKLCKKCGIEFSGLKNKKYCSKPCRVEARKALVYGKMCEKCGIEFSGSKQRRHCSQKCSSSAYRTAYHLPVVKKKCLHCQSDFKTNRTQKVFCSPACCNRNRSKKRRAIPADVKRSCGVCGVGFECAKLSPKIYCSKKCARAKEVEILKKKQYQSEERVCYICESVFMSKTENQGMCHSLECTKKYKAIKYREKNPRTDRVCVVCGGKIENHRNFKYCGDICRKIFDKLDRDRYKRIGKIKHNPVKCEGCHLEFTPKSKVQKYCSKVCSNSVLYRPYDLDCLMCGSRFKNSKPNAKYCSELCKSKKQTILQRIYRSEKLENSGALAAKVCKACGSEFINKHSSALYCSRKCKSKIRTASGFLALRFEVFKRDNFTCKYCGRSPQKDRISLACDHINPVAKNGDVGDPQNLITSCNECNAGKSDVLLDERRLVQLSREHGI